MFCKFSVEVHKSVVNNNVQLYQTQFLFITQHLNLKTHLSHQVEIV